MACRVDSPRKNISFLLMQFEMNTLSETPNGLAQACSNIFELLILMKFYTTSLHMK